MPATKKYIQKRPTLREYYLPRSFTECVELFASAKITNNVTNNRRFVKRTGKDYIWLRLRSPES